MTALQVRPDADARYVAAHHAYPMSGAGVATDKDWGRLEDKETPSSTTVGGSEKTYVAEEAWQAHFPAGMILRYDFNFEVATIGEISRSGEPPADSPFDVIDERRPDSEKVRELISFVRNSLQAPYAAGLSKRLQYLVRVAEEEAPYQSEMSAGSLQTFIHLLRSSSELAEPDVVLTPSGNVRAQWSAGRDKLCAAEFRPDGIVHFVLFAPAIAKLGGTVRMSGMAPVEVFIDSVEPHGVMAWMKQ